MSDVEAIVREAFAALAEGGVEAMLPFVHEDFEMVTPPELASEPDTYRGPAGVKRWFDSFYEAMDEVRIEPGELRPYSDDIVGHRLPHGRARPDDEPGAGPGGLRPLRGGGCLAGSQGLGVAAARRGRDEKQ